ncbi:GntR family transcriptional regulator [Acuticoccus sp. MNP-M23]|uniref:GntR family transcriptional regulator n=1 Tax=Acuticoccus sp. MNP-M23 TaxID=3072793 RepID=UPI0028167F60|nr:GntR family transcriptional regulator [Acuticoccus sp. MNP-M23]WMS41349.1 GntR family transcriptional regulator [Acuticoccus sp. MNP-M23]
MNPTERLERDPNGAEFANRPEPRYVAIASQIEAALASGSLPPGTVLTEEAIARLVGTSRTPVRTALADLASRQLLTRFEGRGYVVAGGGEPRRVPLTPQMLALDAAEPQARRAATAERIATDFEAVVAHALPFGQFRIHEQAAANHYGVSRTVVRELLSRLQDRGLIRKDCRSHWVVGPLTARDVQDYFRIREQLEALALLEAAPHIPPPMIAAMLADTEDALAQGPALAPSRLAALETGMHITLLSHAPNAHLMRMIHQTQIALVVNRVFADAVGGRPFLVSLREHAIVLEFLARGSSGAAANALREHLVLSAQRTRRRLMAFSLFSPPDLPDWLRRVPG